MADPSAPAAATPGFAPLREGGLLPAELQAWMHLLAATGAVEQQLRGIVKDSLGVSHDEFLVLCLLADQPETGLRMTRIAELLGRPKTRLTYQIACLQHAGLITRQSVCGDRRGIQVALTGKARDLLGETSPALAEAVSQALAHAVTPAQLEGLCGLLHPIPRSSDADE
jgi:DNA-binding MarR family transcriptional regulator